MIDYIDKFFKNREYLTQLLNKYKTILSSEKFTLKSPKVLL